MLYKDLTEKLRNVCDSHLIVNEVVIGFEPLHTLNNIEYPLIYIQPSNIIRAEKSLTYTYDIFYADRMGKDRKNILNIIHQSSQVLNDIITKLKYEYTTEILFDFTILPFIDEYDQTLCGHQTTLSIKDLTTTVDNCLNNFSE